MSPAILLILLRAAEVIADPQTRAAVSSVNDAIDTLIDALKPVLPTKPDGSEITREDVLALSAQVDQHFQQIKDEMAKPPAEG